MLELFVIGTFWFWALLVLEVIILFAFVEYENGVGATISLIIFACCLQWLGDVDLLGFVFGNPLQLFICVASYFFIGAIWGTIKWWIFCRDRLEEYHELKEEFLISKGLPAGTKVMPQEHKVEWKRKLENYRGYAFRNVGNLSEAPRVKRNKIRIVRWMSFWPVSMIWSIINDFVKRIFKSIYYEISSYLQHISDNMFGDVQDDLE